VIKLSSRAYKDIKKPSSLGGWGREVEGRCPLCGTVMYESKSASYGGRLYSFDFPLYTCISHYHGHFRWLGGERGHVRILFPQIFKHGKIIGENGHDEYTELTTIMCEDCGFTWEEFKLPPRNETYCPECSRRIDLSTRK